MKSGQSAGTGRVYRIANVEVHPRRACVVVDGREVALRQRTFQVLLYLLGNRDRVVTKEELLETFWKDVVVTEGALTQCIVEIRKAFGDDFRQPRFVKTVPKVGFRFVYPVEEIGEAEPGELVVSEEITSVEVEVEREVEAPRALPPRSRRRLVPSLILGVALVLLGAGAAALVLIRGRSRVEATLPQVAGRNGVAVMIFENRSKRPELDWLREGLADMLITDLSRARGLSVLSRQQLHVLLERSGFPPGEPLRLEQALGVAARSRASVVVLGSFSALGERVRLDAQVHDGRTGRLLSSEALVVERPERILTEIDLLALRLARRLGAPPAEREPESRLGDLMTKDLDAYRYYSLGVERAQAYHLPEAIALFEKAIARDPEFAMAHARIGYTYVVQMPSKSAEGKPHLQKALAIPGRLTPKARLFITAWLAIAEPDFTAAIAALEELVGRYPGEVEAYSYLGRLLHGEERYQEALDAFRKGLAFDPEAADLYNHVGGVYMSLGRHEEALEAVQRYVALAPREPNACDSLGLAYRWAGRYAEAIEAFGRALDLNPDFDLAVIHLGNVYCDLGRYRDASVQFQRFLALATNDHDRARGWGQLAWVHLRKGELREAAEASSLERRHEPGWVFSSIELAIRRGDRAAVSALSRSFREDDTSRGTRQYLRFVHYVAGRLAMAEGEGEEAIARFREALRHRPITWSVESYEDCLADACLELGRLDEAIAEYERVLRLLPGYPMARFHLAQAYERKGLAAEARREYAEFLRLWSGADADAPELIAAKGVLSRMGRPTLR